MTISPALSDDPAPHAATPEAGHDIPCPEPALDGDDVAQAAHVLASLATVVRLMRKNGPTPASAQEAAQWAQTKPAPRHITTLLIVGVEQPIGVSTLAQRLGVSLATASQIVSDLEDQDLVTRVNDPADRRRTLVRVADGRADLLRDLLHTRLAPMQRTLDRLSPTARRGFVHGLAVLADELGVTTS